MILYGQLASISLQFPVSWSEKHSEIHSQCPFCFLPYLEFLKRAQSNSKL